MSKPILSIILVYTVTVKCFDIDKFLGDLGRSFGIHASDEKSNKDFSGQPIYVRGLWIKSPSLKNGQIYLFAQDVHSMTWYEADDYCGKQGAFLAEPFSLEESDFLRDQANRLPKTNWWIGLRQFEKCECTPLRRSGISVAAFVNPDSLQRRSKKGLGKTSCPRQYQKLCKGREWRWGLSGNKLSYTYWNTKTGEPNDLLNEHCVTMWFKSENQRWGNWKCSASRDGENGEIFQFKPVCQKADGHDDFSFE